MKTKILILLLIIAVSLIDCAEKKKILISKARNRNMAFILFNMTSEINKEALDEIIKRVSSRISNLYESKTIPLNFYKNPKLDYKAIFLCGLKNVDTVLLLEGKTITTESKDFIAYEGNLILVDPSTFEELLRQPIKISKNDFKIAGEIQKRYKFGSDKMNKFAAIFEEYILRATKIILPDPNIYERSKILTIADILFENKQYKFAHELYKKIVAEDPSYLKDLIKKLKVNRNLKICEEEMKKTKEEKEFYVELDLDQVNAEFRSIFRNLFAESNIEEEVKVCTTLPVNVTIDYDEVFNKCNISLNIQFQAEFYNQNKGKLKIPDTYEDKQLISFLPYLSVLKELVRFKEMLRMEVNKLNPSVKSKVMSDLVLENFRNKIIISLDYQNLEELKLPEEILFRTFNQKEYKVRSLDVSVAVDKGFFLLGKLTNDAGNFTPYGLLFQFFQE